jgi:hypothetical protein
VFLLICRVFTVLISFYENFYLGEETKKRIMSVVRLYNDAAVFHHTQAGVFRSSDRYELAHWTVTPVNIFYMLSALSEPSVVELNEVIRTIFLGYL